MKRVVVIASLTISVGFFFLAGLTMNNARAMFGMSADALAGDTRVERRPERKAMHSFGGEEGYKDMPAEQAAPSPSAMANAFGEGGLGLRGAGPGGGGIGDAIGIGGIGTKGRGGGTGGYGSGAMPAKAKREAKGDLQKEALAVESAPEAATRAWFPETFLFEPLVVTDAQGVAHVPVRVPDRLTTWRVLALAHSREGAQAGAVASFLGTLPTYVEPVVPAFLYAGDEVRLPVQVVNTTEQAVSSTLRLEALGATLSSAGGVLSVPAGGSAVQYSTLGTKTPGTARVRAVLGETDAVERTIEVKPPGRREEVAHGGSLGAPRTFDLEGPALAIPGSEAVSLRIYPGALGFLRTELSAAPGRGGLAEDGYLLGLLGQAPSLLTALGAEPATDVIRDLTVVATQRVLRHSRSPSTEAASLLAEASLGHPENPVLSRLGERLASQLARDQRPDGTCMGANGWTLQRLLVATAECVRAARTSTGTPAARQRATGMGLKAEGAFERNLSRVADGYTAAAILSSGVVSGTMREALEALVLKDLAVTPDGAKYLPVQAGVVRADGQVPSPMEATALAVLALEKSAQAPLADLGAYLLGGYSPYTGWGDGRTNLVALRAVTTLFREKVPASVRVVLERDGVAVTEGTFGADKLKEVVALQAPAAGSTGKHAWTVRAEPPVPGLGFSLGLVAWVPWKDEPGGGLELKSEVPEALVVGVAAEVGLTAALPAQVAARLRVSLPAGVQADSPSLQKLVDDALVTRFETEDGAVVLHLAPVQAGQVWTAKVKVVPTLAGSLQSGASSLEPEGRPALRRFFAGASWKVKPSAL